MEKQGQLIFQLGLAELRQQTMRMDKAAAAEIKKMEEAEQKKALQQSLVRAPSLPPQSFDLDLGVGRFVCCGCTFDGMPHLSIKRR
jgi:hypothetical protein